MQCGKQRAEPVPRDLNTNTNQQKRRKPHDYDHSSFSYKAGELICESVTEQNTNGDGSHGDERGKNYA